MSNNVYFGKCISSGSDVPKKIVHMEEIPEQFNEGDLLAVFFTNANTYDTPSIVFRTGSTQQEISVADDEGIAIKSYDIDTYSEGLWGAGETVLFCFVQRPNISSDNESDENENEEEFQSQGVLYLEIIGKLQASETNYGISKLNGIQSGESLAQWYSRDNTEEGMSDDYNAAINVATFKALIQDLYTTSGDDDDDDDEDDEQPIILGLKWSQNPDLGEQLLDLGDLSLGNSSESVTIQMPGEYITCHVPKDLFFTPGDEIEPVTTPRSYLPGNGIALENTNLSRTEPGATEGEIVDKPEDTIPYHIRFDVDKLVLGHNNNADFNKVIIRPTLEVDGSTQTNGTIDAGGEINGTRLYGGSSKPNWIPTGGQDNYKLATVISQGDIYEKNDLLKNRYNGKLKVVLAYSGSDSTINDPITITKDTFYRFKISYTLGSNWRPIGIVGYNIDSATTANRKDLSWANVVECFLVNQENVYDTINGINTLIRPKTDSNAGRTNDIEMAIYNMNTSKSIQIRVKVYVLCEYVGL